MRGNFELTKSFSNKKAGGWLYRTTEDLITTLTEEEECIDLEVMEVGDRATIKETVRGRPILH